MTFVDNGDGTATLAGTPAAAAPAGVYPLTITAANGMTPNATQSFRLTVNRPVAITSAAATTFTVGRASSFTITTIGFPALLVTKSGVLPGGVTLVNKGNGTAALSGKPTARGRFTFTITAGNGLLPDAMETFELTVERAGGVKLRMPARSRRAP